MKKEDNVLKKVYIAFLVIFILLGRTVSFADVGDFESYDSGSDWSSSSDWDSSSDWSSSSSWDDDDYYYSSGSSSSDGDSFITLFVFIIIAIVIFYFNNYNGSSSNSKTTFHDLSKPVPPTLTESEIENQIKAVDELFNADDFKSWARDLFIKLQYAWADRDWSTIRVFETNELFEQHSAQLKRYVDNKQINKLERVSVNWVKLLKFEQNGDKDVLNIVLNSKMIDYIIDETTGNVIKGSKDVNKVNSYKLTFVRKTGVKTKAGETTINTTNCPNCGAPTEITSSGKCPYCGSIITTGEYNWVLSNLERYNGNI